MSKENISTVRSYSDFLGLYSGENSAVLTVPAKAEKYLL